MEFKPCPFCGCKEPDISRETINIIISGDDEYIDQAVIYCWGCGASCPAIRWNTRSQPQPAYTVQQEDNGEV